MDATAFWLTLELVLLALLTGSFGADLEIKCGDGDWFRGHRGCYYIEMDLEDYSTAKQDCQDRGGFLLSVGSVEELKYIREQLKPLMKTMDHLKWWVGLEPDATQPGRWRWADGGEFNPGVSKWAPGEPNNAGDQEKCVELNFRMKLNDAACDQKHPYVCENMGRTTTTEMTTVLSTTEPPSQEARLSTVQESTAARTAIRRRDTKGPAVRVTDLPTAPAPDSTAPPASGEKTDTKILTSDVTDYSTHAPVPGTSADATPGTGSDDRTKSRTSDIEADYSTRSPPTLSATPEASIQKEFCESSDSDGLKWPRTRTGVTAQVPCANGVAKWKCEGLPADWVSRPIISDCVSKDLKKVFSEVLEDDFIAKDGLVKPNRPIKKVSAKKVAKAASSLATITQQKDLTAQEVVMTTRALSNLAAKVDFTNSSVEEIKDVVSSVVKTTSSLLSKNKTETWSELPKKDQRESAASMLVGVESSALAIAEVIEKPQVIKKKEENIELELVVLAQEELETQPEVVYESEDSADEFVLPSEMLKSDDGQGLTKIVFVTYHKIADLMQPETSKKIEEGGEEYHPSEPEKVVVSNVISVSVHGKTFQNLRTPIKFTMKHTKAYPSNSKPSCVFWKFASSGVPGEWSVEGCGVVKTNTSHTVCRCNHLTNFAVLMDVQRVQISDVHAMSLQLITYVGCIVSAVCLVVSWLTFQFLKCLQGERNSIHKNLVFCLFVAEILFLFGIDKTYNRILCATLAGLMHYFFLASFTWMFLEGVHIVVMIVQVFDAAKSRLKWYYFAGYGIPLTIVSVSAAVNYQGYGTEHYCWLSTENLFIWSFAGPIAVILLVNATILTYAMSTVCKHSEYVIKEKNRSDSTRAWIQGALALEVLLGLTWVFGYFYINQETIVMAYIFTVLNSLQGLFIFCFHCLLNKKVRKEYKRVLDISRVTTSTNTRSATRSSLHRKQDPSYEMYVGSH